MVRRIFQPDQDRISTGAPCHDERLDPARRYGLVNVEGKFVVQDFVRCTVEPWVFDCQWRDVLAMFGRGEMVAVTGDADIRVIGSQKDLRSWRLPQGFGRPSSARFSFDGRMLWLYSEDSESLSALDLNTGTFHDPVEPGGLEKVGALWVHPERPLVVLDTFQPQDYSEFVIVELREGELEVSEHGHTCEDLSEFIGFNRTGEFGTFVDCGNAVARWSLITGEEHDSVLPSDLLEGDDPHFDLRGISFDGRVGVLWRDQEDHTEHACLLSNELELLYAVDFGKVDDAPYGVELLADGIWRVPFAANTSYYRIRAT